MNDTTPHSNAWRGEVRSETDGNIEARVDPDDAGRRWFVDVMHRAPDEVYTIYMANRDTRDEAVALDYAQTCVEENMRPAESRVKGLGPLKAPSRYVASKVIAAAKRGGLRL